MIERLVIQINQRGERPTHETGTSGNDVAKSLSDRETDASHRALADRRTEAQITAVLNDVDAIKTRARNVYVSVSTGVVTLFGAVRDSGAAHDIKEAVRTTTGIDEVQNNIHTIGAHVGE